MNTEKLNQLKQQIAQLMTINNAKNLITQAKDNIPSKEQIDTSIKTLQEVLHNVYEKSVQGASSVSTVYQKTVNSSQVEDVVAMVYNEQTPEKRQLQLEKVLYLYMLNFGVQQFTPPIDLQTLSESDKRRFFSELLKDNSGSLSDIRRMVRDLLLLFNNDRLGISAVEYSNEFAEGELKEMYAKIIDQGRSRDIMDKVNGQVDDKEFLKHFLGEIIEDVPNGVANDTKYFGQGTDYVSGVKMRLGNFVKGHNVYIKEYIKDGNSLKKEIPKIDRILSTIDEGYDLTEDKDKPNMDKLKSVANKLKTSVQQMVTASSGNDIRVYELESVDTLMKNPSKDPKKGTEIQKKASSSSSSSSSPSSNKRRVNEMADSPEDDREVRQRTGTPILEDDEMDGGRRRRTRRAKSRRGRTYRKRKTTKRGGKKAKSAKSAKSRKTRRRMKRGRKNKRKTRR